MLQTNIANQAIIDMLKAAVKNGRLSHAYMFSGSKGIGKYNLAKWFAKLILCNGEDKPCENCESCKKINNNSHPDLKIYRYENSPLTVDIARYIRQDAYVMPNESDYKVYIIENAEYMTNATPNVLLKIIEEPPANVIFIFTTDNEEAVLETIKSRVINIKLARMFDEALKSAIKNEFPNVSDEKLDVAVILSDGVFGKALDIVNDENYEMCYNNSVSILNFLVNFKEYDMLKIFNSITDKDFFVEHIDCIISLLDYLLKSKTSKKEPQIEKLQEVCNKLTLKKINKLYLILEDVKTNIKGNLNFSLSVNYLCAGMMDIQNNLNV